MLAAEHSHREGIFQLYLERFLKSSLQHKEGLIKSFNDDLDDSLGEQIVKLQRQFAAIVKSIGGKEGVPTEVVEKYQKIIFEYTLARQESCNDDQRLSEISVELCGNSTPPSKGKTLFHEHLGRMPQGMIDAVHEEAYFIVTCHTAEDYYALRPRQREDIQSGGSYHRSFILPFEAELAPRILLVNASDDLNSLSQERIVLHERQHFINDILFNVQDRIKDEIVAYIRDMSSGKELVRALNEPLYKDLFAKLEGKQLIKVRLLIDEVGGLLDKIDHLAGAATWGHVGSERQSQIRAVIVGQLTQGTIEELVEKLRQIEKFYRLRAQEIDRGISAMIDFSTLDFIAFNGVQEGIIFPRAYQAHVKKYLHAQSTWEDAKRRALEDHFFDPRSTATMLAELKPFAQKYKETRAPLLRDGISIPFGSLECRVESLRDGIYMGRDPGNSLAAVRRSENILDAFTKLSHEELVTMIHAKDTRVPAQSPETEFVKNILAKENVFPESIEVYGKEDQHEIVFLIYYYISQKPDSTVTFNFTVTIPKLEGFLDIYY